MLSNEKREVAQGNLEAHLLLQCLPKESLDLDSNQNLKQVYMCSCGKQYLSFPATYLHFRTKHDIKLSTKPTEQRKIVSIQKGYRIITYLVDLSLERDISQIQMSAIKQNKPLSPKSQNIGGQSKIIQECIQKYLGFSSQAFSPLYQKFIQYINQLQQNGGQSNANLQLNRIPYLINDFALEFLPQYSPLWNQTLKNGGQAVYNQTSFVNGSKRRITRIQLSYINSNDLHILQLAFIPYHSFISTYQKTKLFNKTYFYFLLVYFLTIFLTQLFSQSPKIFKASNNCSEIIQVINIKK